MKNKIPHFYTLDEIQKLKPRTLVNKIKKAYSRPRASHSLHQNTASYCVGGAFCLFTAYDECNHRFPSTSALKWALMRVNMDLDQATAWIYAYQITNANDNLDFDLAWKRLVEALQYEPQS